MTTHTPGPLNAVTTHDGRHQCIPIMADWEYSEDAPYHPLIANVFCGRGHAPRATAEATATLFSAAPDLLAACEYAAEFTGCARSADEMATIGKRLKAAIAKARKGE